MQAPDGELVRAIVAGAEHARAAEAELRPRAADPRERVFARGARGGRFAADTGLLIHRLGGLDLSRADRVDFRITAESAGEPIAAVDAVPFDAVEGAVLVACQRHYAALPADTVMSVAIHTGEARPETAIYKIHHRFESLP